jgi:hypothetical protein
MEKDYQIEIADQEQFKPSSIIFTNDGVTVGTLTLSDPMTFTGNVEESAKMFFEYICNNFKF